MFPKRNFKNPKQNQQQQQQRQQQRHHHCHHQQQQQQQCRQHNNFLLQQSEQQQSTERKEKLHINSGRIGERMIIRTTTLTGRRLSYTVTRPFRLAEAQPHHSERHDKCYSSDRVTQGNLTTLTSRAARSTSSITDLGKSRQHVKKGSEQEQSLLSPLIADNEVRFRRRVSENNNEELKFGMRSRCVSTPQSLNRSIPCTYESSQFTGVRSTSYIDNLSEHNLSSRTRTAVVGPSTVHGNREHSSHAYDSTNERGDVQAHYSSDITRTYMPPSTPTPRYDCGDPPPYYSYRRSTQPEDVCFKIIAVIIFVVFVLYRLLFYGLKGQFYPLCSTPLSHSARCEFLQNGTGAGASTADGSMLPRTNRPRDLRITPASSSLMTRAADNISNNISKNTAGTYSTSFRVHGTSKGTTPANGGPSTSVVVDEALPMNSTTTSRKMMVAPQPQNSLHRERNDSNYNNSNHAQQRRQSMGALVPAYHVSLYADNRRFRDRDSPSNDQQVVVDDRRAKNNNDMRVAVLEQRVRELEAAVIPGHASSTFLPSASFIIPVVDSKNSSRILRSASGQFIVSAATTPVTQKIMAQEVVDKEIEVERLQSQLRKCYSRMELRQVQYDEEVNAFRRESEEAKLQLAKVKGRLSELEKECVAYREKAMAVDANRNSTVASSLEKISAQEREIAMLRNDLERHVQMVRNLERIKKEYEFLELQNEALNAKLDSKESTIRDLEDNIHAMKMDMLRKMESGSVTPKGDALPLLDVEPTKFLGTSKESKYAYKNMSVFFIGNRTYKRDGV
ncbi:unnamed protein product [Litomosoides sigmodontis]|uniref:Uncharacterized protein n=1 Tax=Litomosoides sigmodontis TaxID=42156 RepID=A0A3P6T5D6_LITSI|nr:unnamed protein product [Litomosoides sigmodontis]